MAKPISEKQVDLLVERLVNRVQKANEKFLKEIGKKIDEISKLTPSDAHKLTQILDYGGNYDEMVKQIDMYTQKNIAEIDDIFSKYAQKDAQFYEQFYQYKNIPFEEYSQNNALKTQTEALTRLVKNEMYDFTRQNVLGYTIKDLNGNEQFYTLRDTYNNVLDEAFMHVGQGKLTFDEGMSSVLSQLGESGLKTINYTSGRSIRLDSAVKMHLKNRLSELHNENEQLFGEEFGADGVEISVHDNPAPDHASVQGRQFSKEQYERLQKGLVAKDYKGIPRQITHSKKGSYRPISEMNCYHTIYPIVLGVSEPTYSEEQLEEIEENNLAGFELDGNKYTMYEGTQLQRELERRIRGQKDIQILAKECKNNTLIAKSQTQITHLVNKYNELCQVSGLPPKAKRMQVKGYKRTKAEPIINQTSTQKPKTITQTIRKENKVNGAKEFVDIRKVIDESKTLDELSKKVDSNMFFERYNKFYNTIDKKEIEKLNNNLWKWDTKSSEPIGEFLSKKLNNNGLPELIDEKDFWVDKNGKPVEVGDTTQLDKSHWYRGVISEKDLKNGDYKIDIEKTKQYVNDFKRGDFYAGVGINGNGTYADTHYDYAYRYAHYTDEGMIYIMPKDDAKIINIDKINRFKNIINNANRSELKKVGETYFDITEEIITDNGHLAQLLGYDIIDMGEMKLILNRSAIKVVK